MKTSFLSIIALLVLLGGCAPNVLQSNQVDTTVDVTTGDGGGGAGGGDSIDQIEKPSLSPGVISTGGGSASADPSKLCTGKMTSISVPANVSTVTRVAGGYATALELTETDEIKHGFIVKIGNASATIMSAPEALSYDAIAQADDGVMAIGQGLDGQVIVIRVVNDIVNQLSLGKLGSIAATPHDICAKDKDHYAFLVDAGDSWNHHSVVYRNDGGMWTTFDLNGVSGSFLGLSMACDFATGDLFVGGLDTLGGAITDGIFVAIRNGKLISVDASQALMISRLALNNGSIILVGDRYDPTTEMLQAILWTYHPETDKLETMDVQGATTSWSAFVRNNTVFVNAELYNEDTCTHYGLVGEAGLVLTTIPQMSTSFDAEQQANRLMLVGEDMGEGRIVACSTATY